MTIKYNHKIIIKKIRFVNTTNTGKRSSRILLLDNGIIGYS